MFVMLVVMKKVWVLLFVFFLFVVLIVEDVFGFLGLDVRFR